MDTSETITLNMSCTICSEIYKNNDEILCTNCGHFFHKICFEEWKTRSNTCPKCRIAQPQTHSIYLDTENTEAVKSRIDLINKISLLERELIESEQNFLDAQCALTLSDEQKTEFKQQLEFVNALNSSFEQEQTVMKEALAESKCALSLTKEQVDELHLELAHLSVLHSDYRDETTEIQETLQKVQREFSLSKEEINKLRRQLEIKNETIISYKKDLAENDRKISDIRVLAEIEKEEISKDYHKKEMENLKFKHEEKIYDILHQHAVVECEKKKIQGELQNQLNISQDAVIELKEQINKLKSENQYKNIENKKFENNEAANEVSLEEKIKRLEVKLKIISSELDEEIALTTKLMVENVRMKKILALPTKSDEDKQDVVVEFEKERKNNSIKGDKIDNENLLDLYNFSEICIKFDELKNVN